MKLIDTQSMVITLYWELHLLIKQATMKCMTLLCNSVSMPVIYIHTSKESFCSHDFGTAFSNLCNYLRQNVETIIYKSMDIRTCVKFSRHTTSVNARLTNVIYPVNVAPL